MVVVIVYVHVDFVNVSGMPRESDFLSVFWRSSKTCEGNSCGTWGVRLSVIGRKALFTCRRERSSSLLPVGIELM